MSKIEKALNDVDSQANQILQKMTEISLDIKKAEDFLFGIPLSGEYKAFTKDGSIFYLQWKKSSNRWRIFLEEVQEVPFKVIDSRPLIETQFIVRKEATQYLPEFVKHIIKDNADFFKD